MKAINKTQNSKKRLAVNAILDLLNPELNKLSINWTQNLGITYGPGYSGSTIKGDTLC